MEETLPSIPLIVHGVVRKQALITHVGWRLNSVDARETVVSLQRSKLVMKPAILPFERTAVLAVGSDVVLFDNRAHFVMFVKSQNVRVCVSMCRG